MHMNDIGYRDDAVNCRRFVAYNDTASGRRPGYLYFTRAWNWASRT